MTSEHRARSRWLRFLVLGIALLLLVPTAGAAADEARVGYWFGDHHYRVVGEPMSWHEAVEYCEYNLGTVSHLVTVNSAEENQFIFGLFPEGWLGATDEEIEGDWRWVMGEPFDYTNWDEGEPNNCCPPEFCGGDTCTPEHYLVYAYHDGFVPEWNDVPDGAAPFVCESEEPVLPYQLDELHVAVGDTVRVGGRWATCTIGLARAASKALKLYWTLDGEPMATSGEWSDPIPVPLETDNDWCIGNAPFGGRIYWEETLTFDQPGTHEVGLTYFVKHRLTDGGSEGGEPPPIIIEPGILAEFSMVIHVYEP
jgi:hypothetical protein